MLAFARMKSFPIFNRFWVGCTVLLFSLSCKVWMSKIREAWTKCFQDTRRSISPSKRRTGPVAHFTSMEVPSFPPVKGERRQAEDRHTAPSLAAPCTGKSLTITARPVEKEATYELQIVTGDKKGAGTSARVLIELHGVEASSGEQQLRPRQVADLPFQRGSTSKYKIRCPQLGSLRAVRLLFGCALDWFGHEEERLDRVGPFVDIMIIHNRDCR